MNAAESDRVELKCKPRWTQEEAIELCKGLRWHAQANGGFVALTGGTLYSDGPRKDVDILIYRSADEAEFNWDGFFSDIDLALGIKRGADHGWCKKAKTSDGKCIDFFNPFEGGKHASGDDE